MSKARRSGLLVNITPEDEAWAQSQDRWNCAIVRSVQRQVPDALFVTADTKAIAFSIPEDGDHGIRYIFDVPVEIAENVIKNFDQKKPIPEEYRSFTVVAREAKPMHQTKRKANPTAAELRKRAASRVSQRRSARSASPVVRTTNRFLDADAEE